MIVKEKNVKMVEEGDGQFNLDGILSELGSFGKYQLLLLALLAFRDAFLNMCNFNYVFTAAAVTHRCFVPECDEWDGRFNASWTAHALPNATSSCFRLASSDVGGDVTNVTGIHSCAAANFDAHHIVPCERIVYEDYNSIVAEFDLGCEPWKRTLVGTVHNLGLVFSFVISGLISDRYGRKVIIVGTPLVVGTVGLVKSFSVSYWMLLLLEFLETALGYGNASMVLSLETVSQKRRVIFSCIWDILTSFGTAFFGLIAWQVPYWRSLMRAIYAPLLVTVFYIFLVDEGVRWLLAHNKRDEAVRVLNKVAKYNNITLSSKAKDMLNKISEQRKAGQEDARVNTRHLTRALQSRTMVSRLVLVAALSFCSFFVYVGTIINSGTITGDKYLNFAAIQLVNIPTRVITAVTLTRFGRKAPICVSYVLCMIFFIASAFMPKSASWSSLMLYLAGNMASSYGMFSLLVATMEVFPTTSRNSLTNLANTLARFSTVLAPQASLLEQYMSGLTSIVFGVAALGPALLALLLPDASGAELPDDVTDAERLDEPPPDTAEPTLPPPDTHQTVGAEPDTRPAPDLAPPTSQVVRF